jgi:Flp pilus assembly pilin Flp
MVPCAENADFVSMFLPHFLRENGQTTAEYGVVLSVVSALVFAALMLLSDNVIALLTRVGGILAP